MSCDLLDVIETILAATTELASRINQGALADILGSPIKENVHGDTQKKLDVIANELIKVALLNCKYVRSMASEEEDEVVPANESGNFAVAFDPLDGSSNIDINGQIGTIFSIYPAVEHAGPKSVLHFLQGGKKQVCAGYVLYGASTLLVLTAGKCTHCFTFDVKTQQFLLTVPQLIIPPDTQEFSINMSNQRFWNSFFKQYISELIAGENGVRNKHFNMRWSGAMVGDVHRVLMRGGIFMYPTGNHNPKRPAKLRLLYEANPMALMVENAGGKAFTESQRILDVMPNTLHECVAVILGSANEVDRCLGYLNKS